MLYLFVQSATVLLRDEKIPIGSINAYRYGFNGMERDDEVKGSGNSYDYKERFHDTRLGRFLSIDKLQSKFPYYSTYQFAGNKPIIAIDLDGLEEYIVVNYYNSGGEYLGAKVFHVAHSDDRVLGQTGAYEMNKTIDGNPGDNLPDTNDEFYDNETFELTDGMKTRMQTTGHGVYKPDGSEDQMIRNQAATSKNNMENLLQIRSQPLANTPEARAQRMRAESPYSRTTIDIVARLYIINYEHGKDNAFNDDPSSFHPNHQTVIQGENIRRNGLTATQEYERMVNFVKNNPNYTVYLHGVASPEGSQTGYDNDGLSKRRVENMKQKLISSGVPSSQIKTDYSGSLQADVSPDVQNMNDDDKKKAYNQYKGVAYRFVNEKN